MKITGLEIFSYQLPLTQPIVIKGCIFTKRSGLLVKIDSASDLTGWGEIAPLQGLSQEDPGEAREELLGLSSSLVGAEVADDWVPLKHDLPFLPASNHWTASVRFGIELALWNLWRQARPSPSLHEAIDLPQAISLNGLLAGTSDEILSQAKAMVKGGYRAVKVKVGGKPIGEDIRLTLKIREMIGQGVALRLDANRAWSLDEAVKFGRAINGARIDYIEEPLADATHLDRLIAECALPVALDETLLESSMKELIKLNGIKAVILKATLLGGFHRSLQLVHDARRLGILPVISSTFETGVGIAGLARFAAIVSEDIPVGLDTYRWLREDVMAPRIEIQNGSIDLGSLEPGNSEVNRRMLEELTHV